MRRGGAQRRRGGGLRRLVPYISPISPLYLPYISRISPLYLPTFEGWAEHEAAGLHLWYQIDCSMDESEFEDEDEGEIDSDESHWTPSRDRVRYETSRKVFEALKRYLEEDDESDDLEAIEPELENQLHWSPNDPNLANQPHYDAINMAGAWDLEKGDKDVVVQVLDTGIDMDHPDLQQNIWRNPGEICNNGIDDDNNGFVDDCYGYNHADNTGTDLLGRSSHGTHCGGTIAADSNNGVGVAGVAGGDGTPDSGVKLMISVGFGDTNTGGFAEALVYGADNGAQISSNSWGYSSPNAVGQAELNAIDYYNLKKGIVVRLPASLELLKGSGKESLTVPLLRSSRRATATQTTTTTPDATRASLASPPRTPPAPAPPFPTTDLGSTSPRREKASTRRNSPPATGDRRERPWPARTSRESSPSASPTTRTRPRPRSSTASTRPRWTSTESTRATSATSARASSTRRPS